MTDRDQAQIAALVAIYPKSNIFLCAWHVLHAIRSHFATSEFPALWDKIKKLVTTEKMATFYALQDEIFADPSVPQSILDYLSTNWLPVVHMWARSARNGRSIFEEGDTNMLIESYVNY
jgi:hypothetical protein